MPRTLLEDIFIQELDPVVYGVIPQINAASDLKFYEIVVVFQFGSEQFEIVVSTFEENRQPLLQ